MDPTIEAALKAVADAPGDEGRRRVLADLLIERGDPRGEFIVLQLLVAENQASAALGQRARALLAQYRDEWLRELEGVVALDHFSLQVESGFPVAGRLVEGLTTERLRRAFDSPMFLTLRSLEGPQHLLLEALASPRMRALSRVYVATDAFLERVARYAVPARLEQLTLGFAPGKRALTLLAQAPPFSRVRTLQVQATARDARVDLGPLLSALGAHPALEVVRVEGVLAGHGPATAAWPTLRLRRLALTALRHERYRVAAGGTIDYERTPEGTHVLFSGFAPRELHLLKRHVPVGTTHVGLICDGLRASGVDPDEALAAFGAWSPTLNGQPWRGR